MRNFKSFLKEEEGMGTVEIVLIIVVLVALVAIFKDSIKSLVEKILKKVTDNANKIQCLFDYLLIPHFGIVLSLLFVFVEGAAIGAVRAQAELVADLGLDSVFAEYHRELLEQYELFYVDSSYGGVNGGIGMVEKHLSDYMEYNLNPEKDLHLLGQTTLLKLINPYLEIAEVSCASR